MAFTSAVLADVGALDVGEVITTKIHNVMSYDKFQEGLIVGRICVFDSTDNTIKNFSTAPTRYQAGVVKRKVTNNTGSQVYTLQGANADSVCEVVNFGFVVVEVVAGDAPLRSQVVYIEVATGKASVQTTSGTFVPSPSYRFVERVSPTAWLICIPIIG
jgi:hypothetical protein